MTTNFTGMGAGACTLASTLVAAVSVAGLLQPVNNPADNNVKNATVLLQEVAGELNTDDMDKALNYRTITKKIIALVEQQRFSLLEKLTADVLALASEHPSVRYAEVEIDKPYALRFADSVSLSLSVNKTSK